MFFSEGTLNRLEVAFSRDSEANYVQDCMAAKAEELVDVLASDDTMVFVCGDAVNMAKDVNEKIIKLLAEQKGEKREGTLMQVTIFYFYRMARRRGEKVRGRYGAAKAIPARHLDVTITLYEMNRIE